MILPQDSSVVLFANTSFEEYRLRFNSLQNSNLSEFLALLSKVQNGLHLEKKEYSYSSSRR